MRPACRHVLALIITVGCHPLPPGAPDSAPYPPSQLLEDLTKSDQELLQGSTLSFESREIRRLFGVRLETTWEAKLLHAPGYWAIQKMHPAFAEMEVPSSYRRGDDGRALVERPVREMAICDETRFVTRSDSELARIAMDGAVAIEPGEALFSRWKPPTKDRVASPPFMFLQYWLGTGRGFSSLLTGVESVEKEDDGFLLVHASGTCGPWIGFWLLHLEPSDLLVRRAEFRRQSSDLVHVTIETEGLLQANDVGIAGEARIHRLPGRERPNFVVRYRSLTGGADPTIRTEIERQVLAAVETLPPNSTLLDMGEKGRPRIERNRGD